MSSLEETEKAAAAVRGNAPRVSLDHMQSRIQHAYYFQLGNAVAAETGYLPEEIFDQLNLTTVCVLLIENGFTVTGKSAAAHPDRFNVALGEQFAYEDAVRQMWPLEGYLLRERIHTGEVE